MKKPHIILALTCVLLGNVLMLTGLLHIGSSAWAWTGLAGLLLLNSFIFMLSRRISEHRILLENRTAELNRINTIFKGLDANTVIGIYMVDDAMRYIYASPRMAQLLGYKQSKLANGFPLQKIFPPDVYETICLHARQRLSGQVSQASYEATALRSDGTPVDVEIFGARIMLNDKATIIGMMLDISERKRAQARIWHQAHHDILTELPNRQMFQKNLRQSIINSRNMELTFALAFIDLDLFKNINDNYGHEIGDELLRLVAMRLRDSIRETDQVARLGGDEFTIILNALQKTDDVIPICRKVLDSISNPYVLHGKTMHISASAGVTLYPRDGEDAISLLKKADMAMYAAKDMGRNQICLYAPSMQPNATTRHPETDGWPDN